MIVAGYDLGRLYGELAQLQIPVQPQPALRRPPDKLFFAACWGHTPGVRAMVEPYAFPVGIMPWQDCADLAAHLVTSTALLETWSSQSQRMGGPVDVVAMTPATGVIWVRQQTFWQGCAFGPILGSGPSTTRRLLPIHIFVTIDIHVVLDDDVRSSLLHLDERNAGNIFSGLQIAVCE